MDKVFQVTEFSPDHQIEYFMRDGTAWLRETSNGRTLEMTLAAYMRQDLWDLTLYFAVGIDRLNREPKSAEGSLKP